MKFIAAAFMALSLAPPSVNAESSVSAVAFGISGNSVFEGDSFCETIYIQKSGGTWVVANASEASLKDDSYEKLRGCIGYQGEKKTSGPVIDAVIFSVATRGICTTETRCEINGNNKLAHGCSHFFQKEFYRLSTPRSTGYYSCNSNFAGRRMLGGFDLSEPIKAEKLAAALESDSIKAAAASIARSRYKALLTRALQSGSADCGGCREEQTAIRFVFDNYAAVTSPADLETAAFNYLSVTGERQLPEWAASRLAAEAAGVIAARAEQEWRRKYAIQVQHLFSNDTDQKTLQAFIQKYQSPNAGTWVSVDFDNLVPATRQRLQTLVMREQAIANEAARKQADSAERNRQAQTRRIAEWRKSIKIGSDTFCGPVIEMRAPMVKIAVRAQLQGFPNEAWLKTSELFPSEYGCRNTNGRLAAY